MKITDHIQKLSKVLIYAAPDIPIIPAESLPNGFENIEIMLSGEVFYPIDSKLQRFGRGTIFWHQAGEFDIWQNTSVENSYRCVCFTFETSRRARPVPSIGHWQDMSNLDFFVKEAMNLFFNPQADNDSLTAWVYGTLLHQFSGPVSLPENYLPRNLYLALKHIDVVFPQQVTLDELAQIIGTSKMQLNRLFMQHLNCTPGEFILKRRLQYAANLLASRLAIKQIAEECCFQSLAGFYSAFNKYFKISPGQYRKQLAYCQINKIKPSR